MPFGGDKLETLPVQKKECKSVHAWAACMDFCPSSLCCLGRRSTRAKTRPDETTMLPRAWQRRARALGDERRLLRLSTAIVPWCFFCPLMPGAKVAASVERKRERRKVWEHYLASLSFYVFGISLVSHASPTSCCDRSTRRGSKKARAVKIFFFQRKHAYVCWRRRINKP